MLNTVIKTFLITFHQLPVTIIITVISLFLEKHSQLCRDYIKSVQCNTTKIAWASHVVFCRFVDEALPTSQLILQPFRCFTYITVHSPTLLLLLLRHKLFTYVTWRAAHAMLY